MPENNLLERALLRQPIDRTPVWMMRQAGRYLPEYRKVREQAGDFLSLCMNPELACEVTMQPLRRYRFDAAILFSDILTIPDAMGLGLHFVEGEGPKFHSPIRHSRDIDNLPIPDPEQELRYVCDAVRLIKRALDNQLPLIGFSGSPWTLACYMVEGGSSRDFRKVKSLMYEQPDLMHQLLEKLTVAITAYLNAQLAAGVNVVMVFDTWGGALSAQDYQQFSLDYCARIAKGLDVQVPSILFTKGGGQWLENMADAGFNALGLDWTTSIAEARQRVGNKVALQGNMDPMLLYANPDVIRQRVQSVLQEFGNGSGHVFNLGHGILPDINPAHVEAMVNAVHDFSPELHHS
ncbi:MAG: uroporphyrinogen decarboxylase [Gammaproteobacteria bacterium]|nr:uroporphyrinogen decarboxylase [Gammaproteobacteria bacterium]